MRRHMLAAALAVGFATPVAGHDWYPRACCSDFDCAPVEGAALPVATPEGWRIRASGEVIPYGDSRIRQTPPEAEGFHRCSVGGRPEARTLCLFVPLMGA